MAIRLYIKPLGQEQQEPLEVLINNETNNIKIGSERISLGKCTYISPPEYREGKYPTVSIRYKPGSFGEAERTKAIGEMITNKHLDAAIDEQKLYSTIKVTRDENENPIEFINERNKEPKIPFLHLVFPEMTRLSISNYDI